MATSAAGVDFERDLPAALRDEARDRIRARPSHARCESGNTHAAAPRPGVLCRGGISRPNDDRLRIHQAPGRPRGTHPRQAYWVKLAIGPEATCARLRERSLRWTRCRRRSAVRELRTPDQKIVSRSRHILVRQACRQQCHPRAGRRPHDDRGGHPAATNPCSTPLRAGKLGVHLPRSRG